jgi:hypothetical protein
LSTLSSTLPRPPINGQFTQVPVNSSHSVLPARRSFKRRWRTDQLPISHFQSLACGANTDSSLSAVCDEAACANSGNNTVPATPKAVANKSRRSKR